MAPNHDCCEQVQYLEWLSLLHNLVSAIHSGLIFSRCAGGTPGERAGSVCKRQKVTLTDHFSVRTPCIKIAASGCVEKPLCQQGGGATDPAFRYRTCFGRTRYMLQLFMLTALALDESLQPYTRYHCVRERGRLV